MRVDMSVEDAARMLRNAAELTANYSKNWDNFQSICLGVLNDTMAAGRKFGQDEGTPK